MELTFRDTTFDYLSETVSEPQYQELTGEVILPDTMPDVGAIEDCFGVVLVQTKTIESGTLTAAGGIRCGILYRAEEGSDLLRAELYLPFLARKQIQSDSDSVFFYWSWLKSLDARMVNPRKILVRGELGSEFTLLSPKTCVIQTLEKPHPALACKEVTYPMTLPVAWSERELTLTDEILLPDQMPDIEQLLKWDLVITVDESRIIGSKVVFKGNFLLRCLYSDADGRPVSWRELIPYSQYAELDRDIPEGVATIQPILRSLELDTDGQTQSRRLLIQLTATAQIIGRMRIPVTLVEDAYAVCGSLQPTWEMVDLSPELDTRREEQRLTVKLMEPARDVLDYTVFCDMGCREAADTVLELPVRGTILYLDRGEQVKAKSFQTKARLDLRGSANQTVRVRASCDDAPHLQADQLELPVRLCSGFYQRQANRNLAGAVLEPGSTAQGPALIAANCAGDLWQIAKTYRSTVQMIRQANHLQTDHLAEPCLLLIPMGQTQITEEG